MRSDVQREYGGALWMLAQEDDCTQPMLEDVRVLRTVIAENSAYLRLICCPDIPMSERLSLLDAALSGKAHPYLLYFCKLLAERGHFACLPDCLEEFCRRYDAANNIENVTVRSAVPLTHEQKRALGEKISARLRKNVRLHVEIDPTLLGGLRIETESAALDGSVRAKIETIRETLRHTVL